MPALQNNGQYRACTIQFILRQKCIIIAAADKFDTGQYVLKERNVKADEYAVLIVRVAPSLPFSFSLSLY